MKTILHVSSIALVLLLGISSADAQMGGGLALGNSPAYEAQARALRSSQTRQYNFSKAVLGDVMRLMAEDAGIAFFGLPEGSEGADRMVTFSIQASPFTALETLAKANGISLIFENGIWYLRPANDRELIGRIYEINYNSQELVKKNGQGGSSDSGGGSSASAGLNLQGAPDYFVTEPSRLLEDIRGILDLPTTGGAALFAPTTSVDSVNQLALGGGLPDNGSNILVPTTQSSDSSGSDSPAKVIWNSDSNTLYVVATRQQHQWIEAYLASADRPQPMIAIEVKFIEMTKDPSSELGVDWTGVLGDTGFGATVSDATGPLNLASLGSYSLPTAVLSYSDLNIKLRAIFEDRRTRTVSYPRMVTMDNREVTFRSVVNQPVLSSTSSASLGSGGTTTSSVEYIPIGTVINVLPKEMAGGKILLNVSVTVSDIIGSEVINGNPFPIATSRVYTAPLTVQSGFTVAISGLDAASTSENETGLPFLGRLPIVGGAFKTKSKDRSRQHLMMLITPVALNSGTEGLPKHPITREPWAAAPSATCQPVYGGGKAPVNERLNVENPPPYSHVVARPVSEPVFEETSEIAEAESKKAAQTFGKKPSVVARPLEAKVEEKAMGAAGIKALPLDALTKPVSEEPKRDILPVTPPPPSVLELVNSDKAEEKAVEQTAPAEPIKPAEVKESKEAKVEKADAPKEAAEAKPEEPKVSMKSKGSGPRDLNQIKEGSQKLQASIESIPAGTSRLSPNDGQSVRDVYAESKRLLDDIETLRGDSTKPLQGELGDVWWNLIQVKTEAIKLSRRAPESLAINVNEESED